MRRWALFVASLVVATATHAYGGSTVNPREAGGRIAFLRVVQPRYTLFFVGADARSLRKVALPQSASFPDWSSEGRRMVFGVEGPRARLFVAAGDGSNRRVLTAGRAYDCFEHDWNPAGTMVVFERNDGCEGYPDLFVINADGSGRRRIVRGGGFAPAWSPDGRSIAFLDDGITIVGSDGRSPRTIARGSAVSPDGRADRGILAWSRDAKRLFFVGHGPGRPFDRELWAVNPDGRAPRRLTPIGLRVFSFELSPDGRELAVGTAETKTGKSAIRIVASHGSSMRILWSGDASGASWSPDGRRVVVTAPDGLYDVAVDGSSQRRITRNRNEHAAVWLPAGR